jgi:hypothetical protein
VTALVEVGQSLVHSCVGTPHRDAAPDFDTEALALKALPLKALPLKALSPESSAIEMRAP